MGVAFFNQTDFPITVMFFKAFLSGYSVPHYVVLLEIHKHSNIIALGKAINGFRFVLIHTFYKIARDPDVECAARFVR